MTSNFLKNIPLFSGLTASELEGLQWSAKKRAYPHGSIVLHKGDTGDMIYFILKGKVKVVLGHRDGREVILNILKPKDYFGEMAVFDNLPRSATIVAEEDCEFFVLSRQDMIEQIGRQPQMALKMLSEMSGRIREVNEQVSCLANLDARGRVAQSLLKLLKKADVRIEEGCQTIPKPLLKDIAAMSGTSRETVSRVLAEFTRNGIIRQTNECIIIYESLESEN